MAKETMTSGWEPFQFSNKKASHVLLKICIFVLLMGFAFRLLFSQSSVYFTITTIYEARQASSPLENPNTTGTVFPQIPPNTSEQQPIKGNQAFEKSDALDMTIPTIPIDVNQHDSDKKICNLFSGKWVPHPSGPAYTNTSCPFIEDQQNCMTNGRLDTDYQYWRWKPYECEVAPFDPNKFLETMHNKSWAFIGDSILRNHAQSLVCLLSKAEMAVLVYHDEDYKSRTWNFPSHNFNLSVVWSPFLAKADIYENDNGVSKSEIQLHLNTLNTKWTDNYTTYDYVLVSVGQWFLKTAVYWENERVVGCHYCPRLNLTELGLDYAYRRVLQSFFKFVTKSSHKPSVFYRTWTPDHFENGEWSTNGICNRTLPYKEGEYSGKNVDHLMYNIELEEFRKIADNFTHIKLLDTYHLSLLRPDGHPGPYRNFRPFDKDKNRKVQNDCLHWCLPGPIDAWNELLMKMVVKD